jgi:hypothetical protein
MRRSRLPARLLTAAVVAFAVAAVTVPAALADTNTSTSDSGLAVTASLSPDIASGGQEVTQTATVSNDGHSTVNVSLQIFGPRRSAAPPQPVLVTLAPGDSYSQSAGFPASALSRGTHTKDSALACVDHGELRLQYAQPKRCRPGAPARAAAA